MVITLSRERNQVASFSQESLMAVGFSPLYGNSEREPHQLTTTEGSLSCSCASCICVGLMYVGSSSGALLPFPAKGERKHFSV